MLGLLVTSILLSPVQDPDLTSLNWLLGRWVAVEQSEGIISIEAWDRVSEEQFTGISYSTNGKDTSLTETLEISRKGDDFYYIADVPHNAVPVPFKIIEMSTNSLICENLGHDFPKRIEYRRKGNRLTVTISAGEKSRQFHFLKEKGK